MILISFIFTDTLWIFICDNDTYKFDDIEDAEKFILDNNFDLNLRGCIDCM